MLGTNPAGVPTNMAGQLHEQNPAGPPRAATGANQVPLPPRPPFGNPMGFSADQNNPVVGRSNPSQNHVGPPSQGADGPIMPGPPANQGPNNVVSGANIPPPPTCSPASSPVKNSQVGGFSHPMAAGQQPPPPTGPPPNRQKSDQIPPPPQGPQLPLLPMGSNPQTNMHNFLQSLFQGINMPQKQSGQPPGPDPSLQQNKTLYVNNIDDKIRTEVLKKELKAMFQNFGEVADVIAMKSFWRRGQAWVIFISQEAATQALNKLQGFPYNGKPLRINYALARSDYFTKTDGTFVSRDAGPRKPRAILEREKQLQIRLQELRTLQEESQRQAIAVKQQQEESERLHREQGDIGSAAGRQAGETASLPFTLTSQQQAFTNFFQQQQRRRRGETTMSDSKPLLELPANAVRIRTDGETATGTAPPVASNIALGSAQAPVAQPQTQAGLVADLALKAAQARDALTNKKRTLEGTAGDVGTLPNVSQLPVSFNAAALAAAQAAAATINAKVGAAADVMSPTKKLKTGLTMGFVTQPQKIGGGGSNVPSLPHDKLFVTDLPEDCTDMMLEMLFRQYSGFKEVRLIQGRRVAFVEFESVAHATAAMTALQGMEIKEGARLKISYAKR